MRKFPTLSVVYNRLGYQSKTGMAPLYLRIYYKGKADFVILSDVPKVHKRDWLGDAQQDLYVINPRVNKLICNALHSAREWSQDKVLRGDPLSVAEIKNHLKVSQTTETFNEFVDRFIININRNKNEHEKLSFRTIQTYRSFEGRLNEFSPEIRFDDLTPSFVSSFERFLAINCKLKGVTRSKHFDKFRICYRGALKEGLVKYDEKLLFDDIKIKEEKSRRVSLSEGELRLFKNKELENPRDNYFKNIFLFACLTGLYYSDIRELSVSNIEAIQVEENGETKTVRIITGNRFKNEEQYVVKVFEDTELLLRRWSNWPDDQEGALFSDLITDQKFNEKLKDIAKQLGIDKRLSAKVGRHTFAELMISRGVPVKKVSGALGHQLTSTTEGTYGRQSKSNAVRGWIDFKL